MARDDDGFNAFLKSSNAQHVIGEPLDAISIEELGDRINLLHAEIQRLEKVLVNKRASRDAAKFFFKGN